MYVVVYAGECGLIFRRGTKYLVESKIFKLKWGSILLVYVSTRTKDSVSSSPALWPSPLSLHVLVFPDQPIIHAPLSVTLVVSTFG